MKIDYKKQAEEWEDKYCDEYNRSHWDEIIWGIIFSTIIIFLLLFGFGAFGTPLEELDVNKDKLAESYVLEYYPEYNNCSMEYDPCVSDGGLTCRGGVNIYCEDLGNRDGLRTSKTQITESIIFEGITLEEIFEKRMNDLK